jgi:hypothetical protein
VHLPPAGEPLAYRLFTGDIVDESRPWRHDSEKLAARIVEVFAELHTRQDPTAEPGR